MCTPPPEPDQAKPESPTSRPSLYGIAVTVKVISNISVFTSSILPAQTLASQHSGDPQATLSSSPYSLGVPWSTALFARSVVSNHAQNRQDPW